MRSRPEQDQARTIARATFDGFLQSDLMPTGMQAPAIIWAAAFMVAPSIFLAAQNLLKYPLMRRFHPEAVEPALWSDRMLFLLLSAGGIGLVAVVLWDTLFPARRDAFVLTPLPVRVQVQMAGRLLGLMTLALAFVVLLNALPAVTFPFASVGSLLQIPRFMAAHVIAVSAADVFVFFGITALQGCVILLFGRRASARLASLAQAAAVLLVLLALLFSGAIRELTREALAGASPGGAVLDWNPLAWFLGLYEVAAGTGRAVMWPLAGRAVAAALVPVAITVAIYAFGYQRLLRRAVETPSRSTASWLSRAASSTVRAVFIRRPQEQAMSAFLLRAISRSARHSLLMSIYVGAALALIVTVVLTDFVRFGYEAMHSPLAPWPHHGSAPISILVSPLMLSAALAVGVRILMTIPAEMNARWIFMTTALTPRVADAATHKALLLVVVPTVMTAAMLSAGLLWGVRFGALHAVYCGALAILLCEILLLTFRGVPLTRPYIPGASRFHVLWLVYITGFTTYTFTAVRLEMTLLGWAGSPGVLRAAAVLCGIALGFWGWRKLRLRGFTAVPFEADLPDDLMFQGFNLSEIHAAQSVARSTRPTFSTASIAASFEDSAPPETPPASVRRSV
jgi:hypothetical protein